MPSRRGVALAIAILFHACTVRSHDVPYGRIQDVGTPHEAELALLRADTDQLSTHSRKPDCFHRVAGAIAARCGDLSMRETDRVGAAISMTLCELATAHHSPPLECVSFAPEPDRLFTFPSNAQHSTCVEALSRSAQYWSSYSGYLREVSQLCYAFRQGNDIDAAKEVYRNTTYNALVMLEHIERSSERGQVIQTMTENVMQRMASIVESFDDAGSSLTVASATLRQEIENLRHSLSALVADVFLAAQVDRERERDHNLAQFDVAIGAAVQQHQRSIATLSTSVQGDVEMLVSSFTLSIQQAFNTVSEKMDALAEKSHIVDDKLDQMQESVSSLTRNAGEAAGYIRGQLELAEAAHVTQRNATQNAVRLTELLHKLAEDTREEMQDIANVSVAMREEMLSARRAGHEDPLWSWGKITLFRIVEDILRVSPTHQEALLRLPVLRALQWSVEALYLTLRACLSSATSLLIIVMSCKRWLLPEKAAGRALFLVDSGAPSSKSTNLLSGDTTCHQRSPTTLDLELLQTTLPSVTRAVPSTRLRRLSRSRSSRVPDRLLQFSQ